MCRGGRNARVVNNNTGSYDGRNSSLESSDGCSNGCNDAMRGDEGGDDCARAMSRPYVRWALDRTGIDGRERRGAWVILFRLAALLWGPCAATALSREHLQQTVDTGAAWS